jgi:hypothetical protein
LSNSNTTQKKTILKNRVPKTLDSLIKTALTAQTNIKIDPVRNQPSKTKKKKTEIQTRLKVPRIRSLTRPTSCPLATQPKAAVVAAVDAIIAAICPKFTGFQIYVPLLKQKLPY